MIEDKKVGINTGKDAKIMHGKYVKDAKMTCEKSVKGALILGDYIANIAYNSNYMLSSMFGMLVKRQLLDNSLKGNVKGGIYENLIAGILERKGCPIRYYRNDDGKIEFIVETENGVVPVEVKASTGRTLSLNRLLESDDIPYGIKLTGGNVGVTGKKRTLPHYMAMFVQVLLVVWIVWCICAM